MDLAKGKEQFIQTWGVLGTDWGINRTMAQIHATLLVSSQPKSMDDLMEELSISRGNVNMNLRELIAWGLVRREIIAGERKEFFVAEKDIWEVAKCIMRERKKRELEPIKKIFEQLVNIKEEQDNPEYQEFIKVSKEISSIAEGVDNVLDKLMKVEKNWFLKKVLKFFSTASNKKSKQ